MTKEISKQWSIILAVFIFTLGIVISTYTLANSLIEVKGSRVLTVTGSAKKQITSDLIVWQGTFSSQSSSMQEAYTLLENSQKKVKAYLLKNGVNEKEIVMNAIYSTPIYEVNFNGVSTNNVIAYRLSQNVEIKSSDIDAVTTISRNATTLINDGVDFQSLQPQYFYTKLSDLKINMIAEATKDAKLRAEQIAINTGGKVGKIKSAKMGVFQITPLYSTEISDAGMFDTYSLEKEITSVVTCQFEIE